MSNYTVNGVSILPPSGSVIGFLGQSDPLGWVIADGSNRTNTGQYNTLLSMGIGTGTTGSSTTPTTYTTPNYKGAFLRGIGGSGSYIGPTNINTSQTDSYTSHNHGVTDPGHFHAITDPGHSHPISGARGNYYTYGNNDSLSTYGTNTSAAVTNITINTKTTDITINSSGGTETRPYNYGVNWIIKL